MLQLYDLAGADPARRFSPYCWRVKLALAHKRLDFETIPWRFTEKAAIAPFGAEKVPVLIDGGHSVFESFAIAEYLEDKFPERPSLFGGKIGLGEARFINAFGDAVVAAGLSPLIVHDVYQVIDSRDKDYFRTSREKRFGKTLSEVVAGRDKGVIAYRKSLHPMRMALREQAFICGDAPAYADYILFGPLQWARCTSAFQILEPDDPIYAWRERMLDLFDGLARKAIGFPV